MAQIFLDTVTLLGTATAASALNNIYCCQALSGSDVANKVFYPGDATYNESISSYFSLDAQLAPECIIQPTTADDVSTALSVLVSKINSEQSCHFAVRSGGHTCWAGAANIEKGVTIDLSLLNSAIYNEEDSTASVGPGARWASVYEGLAKSGVTIPGGRAGTVGVGGLTLGGGNSFFAAREGFVCDNVANFEIVLASGEIANANSEENADLWHALKGGSNNFGIVTKIDFFAFPFDSLWGGVVAYPGSTASDQISAFVNFNDNLKDDPFASVISIWQSTSEMPELVILNAYEYTKPEPNPPILGEFLAIPGNISDSMRITDLRDVTEELEQAAGT
ncbi:hypothetical protein FQN54_009139 [Arachnomyces sp. PD_36]|nr:hypothetical protein FQN54_009139 [Arachnomyces sp. PD_36]